MTQQEIQQFVYDFLYDKSLSHDTICAIMGNITVESGWNVDAIENGTSIGFGLCQWSFGRRDQLEAYGTDLQSQCEFLWSELTGENTSVTGASLQWISNPADSVTPDTSYSFSLDDFLSGNGTIEELVMAWCYCWERPAYATNHMDRRLESAYDFLSTMSYGGITDENAIKIGGAIDWCLAIAKDDTHGYDQTDRWGPDYDCSSFIIQAYKEVGIDTGATYTGDMESCFVTSGFESLPFTSESELQTGDILLTDGHVVMYIGNGEIVHASINENGEITGGVTGDQTGEEICVRSYYDGNWTVILRLPHTQEPPIGGSGGSGGGVYDGDSVLHLISLTPFNLNAISEEQQLMLDNIHIGDKIELLQKFRKNKINYGVDCFGKRLYRSAKVYTIKDVVNNGFLKLIDEEKNELYYCKVNPNVVKGGICKHGTN